MKKSYIWLAVAAILVLYGVVVFNGIIKAKNEVEQAWADVESTYQRRYDLVPNLAKVVKKYADYEQETFLKVTEARTKAKSIEINPDNLSEENLKKFMAAQGEFKQSLDGAFNLVVERYPDLKANENFLKLQDELSGTESRINVARKRYNQAVKVYNVKIERFPGFIIAGFKNLEKKPMYEAPEGSDEVPDVDDYI